jgi:hypothetical protein
LDVEVHNLHAAGRNSLNLLVLVDKNIADVGAHDLLINFE